jgi:hypothetical protein
MAALFLGSRRRLPEEGETGRPAPCGGAGQHAFWGTIPVRIAAPLSAHQRPLQATAQGSVCLPRSAAVSLTAKPAPAAFRPASPRGILTAMSKRPRSQAGRAVARSVALAVPPARDLTRGPVVRSRPVRKRSPPPFQTLSQIGNVITELPAGPAVVPPINGSVGAFGGQAF